jgi:cobalamin synthase
VIVALLLLILATLVAGPVGFVVMALVLLTWALVTGTLHLVIDLILLPFRIIGALARGR